MEALTGNYRPEHVFTLRQALELWDFYQAKIAECDIEIEAALKLLNEKRPAPEKALPARRQPRLKHEPKFDIRTALYTMLGADLSQIHGFGPYTVLRLVAECGDDMSRWPTAKHFTSWLSLAPGNKISGGRAFIDAEKAVWPIEVQCDVLGVSRSGFYAWKGRPEAPRAAEDAELVVEIKAAHKAGRGNYWSPRVHRELRAKGRSIGRKRVERLMRREGIIARKMRRFRRTTDSNHTHPIAPNVLERNFAVELPDTAWVTDVTYVLTHDGWLYLAVILDLFSRRVIGWAASANNDRALALGALDRATRAKTPDVGLIHHSDRGSVYASGDYGEALIKIGAVKSMSRKADCWDNAVAESFFATIKGEMIDHEDYRTRGDAIAAIADYIDAFYNPCRRHSAIGYVSPIEFELMFMSEKIEKIAA